MTNQTLSLIEIKTLLEPMGNVVSIIQDHSIILKKDNVTFGTINNDKICLLDSIGAFKQVDRSILRSSDDFLREATKAYWGSNRKPQIFPMQI